MKIPNDVQLDRMRRVSLARIVSEDSQRNFTRPSSHSKSSKDS